MKKTLVDSTPPSNLRLKSFSGLKVFFSGPLGVDFTVIYLWSHFFSEYMYCTELNLVPTELFSLPTFPVENNKAPYLKMTQIGHLYFSSCKHRHEARLRPNNYKLYLIHFMRAQHVMSYQLI